jgi:hypothetical protein
MEFMISYESKIVSSTPVDIFQPVKICPVMENIRNAHTKKTSQVFLIKWELDKEKIWLFPAYEFSYLSSAQIWC